MNKGSFAVWLFHQDLLAKTRPPIAAIKTLDVASENLRLRGLGQSIPYDEYGRDVSASHAGKDVSNPRERPRISMWSYAYVLFFT